MTVTTGFPRRWLRETRQLDLSHPKIRYTALRLTQSLHSQREQALAIFDFVRAMPFGAVADGTRVRASTILRSQRGDCLGKGVLFVALCRVTGIPARLNFVRIGAGFMHGVLNEGPDEMPHAVGQVFLDGRWISTDAYVVDPFLFDQAQLRLAQQAVAAGWGVVRGAQPLWDGATDCLHQFQPADVRHNWGAYNDPAEFYAELNHDLGSPSWGFRMKYALGARLVNRRVAQVRQARQGPAAQAAAA